MIYYVPQYGIGNIIQTTPAVSYLVSTGEPVTVIAGPTTEEACRAVFAGRVPVECRSVASERHVFRSCHPSEFRPLGGLSEVRRNLDIVGARADFPRIGFCGYSDKGPSFDVVFVDGYNKRRADVWEAKSYPHWHAVAACLQDYRLASIGLPGEEVRGTCKATGLPLLESLGIVARSRLVVTNDTGMYHAAAALGVPCLAVFTFTDTDKNHDPEFHQSAEIITRGLDCQPCQLRSHLHWMKARPSCGWACRDIPPETIAARIRSALHA